MYRISMGCALSAICLSVGGWACDDAGERAEPPGAPVGDGGGDGGGPNAADDRDRGGEADAGHAADLTPEPCRTPGVIGARVVEQHNQSWTQFAGDVQLRWWGAPVFGVPFATGCDGLLSMWPSAVAQFVAPHDGHYVVFAPGSDGVRTKVTVRAECADAGSELAECATRGWTLVELSEGERVSLLVASPQPTALEVVVEPEPFTWIDEGGLQVYVRLVEGAEGPQRALVGLRARGFYKGDFVPAELLLETLGEDDRVISGAQVALEPRDVDARDGVFSLRKRLPAGPGDWSRVRVSVKSRLQAPWSPAVEATVRLRQIVGDGAECDPDVIVDVCEGITECFGSPGGPGRCASGYGEVPLESDDWYSTGISFPHFWTAIDRASQSIWFYIGARVDPIDGLDESLPPTVLVSYWGPDSSRLPPFVRFSESDTPDGYLHPVRVGLATWLVPGPVEDLTRPYRVGFMGRYAPRAFIGEYRASEAFVFGRADFTHHNACGVYAYQVATACRSSPYTDDHTRCREELFFADCLQVTADVFAEAAPLMERAVCDLGYGSDAHGFSELAPFPGPRDAGAVCWPDGFGLGCDPGLACQLGGGQPCGPFEGGCPEGLPTCRPLAEGCPDRWPVVDLARHRVARGVWAYADPRDHGGVEVGGGRCATSGLADVFRFTAPADGTYHAVITAYDGDPLLFARSHCAALDLEFELACHDDFLGEMKNPGVELALERGQTVFLFVGNKAREAASGSGIDYRLRLAEGPLPGNFGRLPGGLD